MSVLAGSLPLVNRFVAGLRQEIFTSPLETIGTLLGVANIVLLIKRSIWNYPAGILSVTLLGVVFFHSQLFSDTLLQIFFVAVQIAGWVVWRRHQGPDGELVVERTTRQEALLAFAATVAGAFLLGFAMRRYTHAAFPYWDAGVASASVVGQLLLTWRRMENWFWWMGSNLVSIVIYNLKGLHILSGLYGLYLVMCVFGYVDWRARFVDQGAEG